MAWLKIRKIDENDLFLRAHLLSIRNVVICFKYKHVPKHFSKHINIFSLVEAVALSTLFLNKVSLKNESKKMDNYSI